MKLTLALLLSLCCSLAAAADDVQPLQEVREAALGALRAQAAPSARLEAVALDERLRLPRCAGPLRVAPETSRGGAQQRVAVSCVEPVAWTLYVGVRITDIRPVLTLTRNGQRGEALGTEMLVAQERDVAGLPQGYFSSPAELNGRQLRRAAMAGSVLTPELVEGQRLVRRGDLVTVLGRAGTIEVRSQGKALRDGARGDRIPVENSSSRRIVEGRINEGGQVEIGL